MAAASTGARPLDTVDVPVAEWVAAIRTPLLTDLFNAGSRLGDNVVVFASPSSSRLHLQPVQVPRHRPAAAAAFRPAIEFVLKAVIDRARPTIEPLGHFHGPSHPSGHPLAAASLWGLMPAVVALHFRSRGLWWATVAASSTVVVVVAAARVYKGAHYLTDVVALAGLGRASTCSASRARSTASTTTATAATPSTRSRPGSEAAVPDRARDRRRKGSARSAMLRCGGCAPHPLGPAQGAGGPGCPTRDLRTPDQVLVRAGASRRPAFVATRRGAVGRLLRERQAPMANFEPRRPPPEVLEGSGRPSTGTWCPRGCSRLHHILKGSSRSSTSASSAR